MKMKKKKTNNISYGLFHSYSIWRNIKDIPIFFKRLHFLLLHGYSPMAKWETSEWFIDVMTEIMLNYRNNRFGDMPVDGVEVCDWKEANDKLYDQFITLLGKMSELYWHSEGEKFREAIEAKNKFFKLFAENFYDLWD